RRIAEHEPRRHQRIDRAGDRTVDREREELVHGVAKAYLVGTLTSPPCAARSGRATGWATELRARSPIPLRISNYLTVTTSSVSFLPVFRKSLSAAMNWSAEP